MAQVLQQTALSEGKILQTKKKGSTTEVLCTGSNVNIFDRTHDVFIGDNCYLDTNVGTAIPKTDVGAESVQSGSNSRANKIDIFGNPKAKNSQSAYLMPSKLFFILVLFCSIGTLLQQ
jgi:hypothetical protein